MPPEATNNVIANNKWLPDLIRAYRAAGGETRFPQIYRWIESNRPVLPDEWEAAVRACVYAHSSDSPVYRSGNPDVFFKKAHGLWALRFPDETIAGKSDNDLFIQVIASMSKEQLESYSGKGDELLSYVKAQVAELKRKYNIGG